VRALGYVARLLAIVAVAAFSLVRYAVGRLGTLAVRDPRARRRAVAHLRGRVLRGALSTLGATFIKLGQVMSTRPDLLEPELIEELKHLQDKLPPFPGRAARRQLEAELGRPVGEVFAAFEDVPVAAASVAQVHRARRPDGTEVAVKILRPDVRRKTERDGAILLALARLASKLHPHARHADLAGHLSHFVDGVLAQTDLRTEAANYERFRANFADVPHVDFPHVYEALSGETVMTMDFVRGRKVDTLRAGEHPQTAARLRNAFLKMLFDDGFLHADLHPGNLLIRDDGTIAIFDVGLSKQLSDELLEEYIDFNKCLVMGTAPDFVQHLRTYHSYADGRVDWEALSVDVEEFVGEFRGKPASELEFGALIERVFAVSRKHGIRPVPDMTLIMVGLVTAEGIGKQLDPDSDSFGEVASYLMPILARRGMLPAQMPTPPPS
jgi:ubiquinone biosynthesis protein